jgi:two-component system LytT family sensor kinase
MKISFPAISASTRAILRDALTATGLWLGSLLLLGVAEGNPEVLRFWSAAPPCGIVLYCLAGYYLVPTSLGKRWAAGRYLLKVLLVCLVLLLVALWGLADTGNEDTAMGLAAGSTAFQLLLTTPFAWAVFKGRRQAAELAGVRAELGQSAASLAFLRSQVNPHFLFNALNTLYGMALQENGERTAQGIQMLGDMMRFLLHESHQPLISLAHECDYLRQYIALHALWAATLPNISIQTTLEDVPEPVHIAPMLLIPFVENAFKHGISLSQPSWVKVALRYEPGRLSFDVCNSNHARTDPSVEETASGVGLENVRQRLALLYPGRHELTIRQAVEEYFVHLILHLA